MAADEKSPFELVPESEWIAANELAFAFFDAFPVSKGHALVVPKRVVATRFDASPDEQRAIFALVDKVKRVVDETHRPDGENVGFNAGEADLL